MGQQELLSELAARLLLAQVQPGLALASPLHLLNKLSGCSQLSRSIGATSESSYTGFQLFAQVGDGAHASGVRACEAVLQQQRLLGASPDNRLALEELDE